MFVKLSFRTSSICLFAAYLTIQNPGVCMRTTSFSSEWRSVLSTRCIAYHSHNNYCFFPCTISADCSI